MKANERMTTEQMIDEPISTRDILALNRERILRKLVDLAAGDRKPADAGNYRKAAEDLVQELLTTERAIVAVTPQPSREYAGDKRAVEAIVRYLRKIDRPASETEIVRELCDGGFRGGVPGTSLVIEKSIRSYIFGTGKQSGLIKKVGGLIGLGIWDDSRFM
jgi:hypothetical protein